MAEKTENKVEEKKPMENIEKEVKKEIETSVKKEAKKIIDKKEKPKEEKVYVIPLRDKVRVVPRYKKTNKAVKTIKEFLVRHMKIRDRDLKKIKLSPYLNEFLWERGIRYPPHKVKVKAFMDGEVVRVELAEVPYKLEKKKARHEKILTKAVESGKKKPKKKEEEPIEEGKKEEEKEKKSSVVEEGKALEKAAAKKAKHTSSFKGPASEQKTQKRPVSH